MKNWVDAHCHYASPLFDERRKALDKELHAQGCRALVLAGIDADDWERQTRLTNSPLQLLLSFGIHPWTVHAEPEEKLEEQFRILEGCLDKATTLGEIGLDYYRGPDEESRQKQKKWFLRQLTLGRERDLPIILHVVRAHHDVLPVLRKLKGPQRGIVHSFWASSRIAEEYVEKGWILSLPPRILHRDDHNLLSSIPPESIVFESDSPDRMPDGSQSSPLKLLPVFQKAAETWKIGLDEVLDRQTRNLARLFPELEGV